MKLPCAGGFVVGDESVVLGVTRGVRVEVVGILFQSKDCSDMKGRRTPLEITSII